MTVNPIFILPALAENQEWACVQGCTVHTPKLYRNVYSQQWDLTGKLIKELSEKYYTCHSNHLLMVWDNSTNDYVDLDKAFYREVAQ